MDLATPPQPCVSSSFSKKYFISNLEVVPDYVVATIILEFVLLLRSYHVFQEAHGPPRSPEKPVQINEYTFKQSYDHIYYKTGPMVQEEKILNFVKILFQFCNYLSM